MRAEEAAKKLRDHVEPPWNEERAARVQSRVMRELAAPRESRTKRTAWLAMAAAACLAAALLLVVWAPWARPNHLTFEDGSYAEPARGATVIPIVVSSARVELDQARGSVSYEVVPRQGREFVVRAGGVTVEVLGTAFTVDREDSKVEVQVQRGKVRVSRSQHTVVLSAGERVVLDDSTANGSPSSLLAASVSPPSANSAVPVESLPTAEASATGTGSGLPLSGRTAAELFRDADEARASGNVDEAIRLLTDLISNHPKDARVTLATFTIGRLHMQRGRAAQAAQSFEACGAALGGEALAEAALARSAAGQGERARSLAHQYLERFPSGARAREMSRLAP